MEVRRISHNLMPRALAISGLQGAVEDLIQDIEKQDLTCELETEGLETPLPAAHAVTIYRIFYSTFKIVLPMKNAIFILFSLLFFVSCKKDSNDGPYFKCNVDGAAFEVDGLQAYAVNFSSSFTVYGVKGQTTQEICQMTFPAGTKAGTYSFNNDIEGYFTDTNQVFYGTIWGDGLGSVTIEEIDATHVKGTFEYTAYDSDTEVAKKVITNGSFDVNFR